MKLKQTSLCLSGIAGLSALLFFGCAPDSGSSGKYTRGIGVYPGNPDEYYGPELLVDNSNYRNVAKLRAAYHSSSYDYNLTAQLVTDGLFETAMPSTINVTTQNGDLLKNEREWFFDGKSDSRYRMKGDDVFLQLSINNSHAVVDRIVLRGTVTFDEKKARGYEITLYGSSDGLNWDNLGQDKGAGYIGTERPTFSRRFVMPPVDPDAPKPSFTFNFTPPSPTRILNQTFTLDKEKSTTYAYYKIAMKMPSADEWSFSDWDFYDGDQLLTMLPSKHFNSSWMSEGTGEEWVYVDLGAPATFDKVNLHWINKAVSGKIQTSDDAKSWTSVADLPGGTELTDVIDVKSKGRYVRVLMNGSENKDRYILSELEVLGKGGLVARPHKALKWDNASNSLYLSGGQWTVQRSSEVKDNGEAVSQPGFDASNWVVATVPGTVLTSYWNAGALPDPNYADNQLQVSESFFNSNFWYRNEFSVPSDLDGGRLFLNFDGINWKANVYVNGKRTGRIEGAFMRGKFDVTDVIALGKTNVIAVEIIKNDNPGAIKEQTFYSTDQNGGILGADNPTFHATVGWDWIPTIRGRDIGIWNDVFITRTGNVTVEDPFVRAELPLPDTTSAKLFVEVTLKNNGAEEATGKLKGNYGNIAAFEKDVTLAAYETKTIHLDASTEPSFKLNSPRLWWPKGYGEPYLYDVAISFEQNSKTSDIKKFKSGIRQMTFNEDNNTLSLFVNGRRFIGFGGNWGFGESNLNYRGREYDIAVAYHADMNFTMIRNWVGQIGDEEFFEACDRHGVMVWQDFWLANPVDGPNPTDNELFMSNVHDFVKLIRNHPSIGIYVGRNEGNPPDELDNPIREYLPIAHPGIHYISNSAMGVVSGGGPYRALPPRDYFLLYGNDKFHSERGMPNVMNYESLVQTFSPEALWPQNKQYGIHDYTLGGTQGASAQAAASFNAIIEKAFGQPKDAKQFAEWAQWINYDGYRAIFEGRSEFRRGMLLWMSHPAWPSMVWQTYDYYFDPTGAYFGCKKASEAIHIQWNPVWDDIEVVNYHAFNRSKLTAQAQLVNLDGSVQWDKSTIIDIPEDATVKAFKLEFPESLSETYFIKLTLKENDQVISENFYWKGKEDGDYKALHKVPKVKLSEQHSVQKKGDSWLISSILKNETQSPALMIRLKVSGNKSGQRILPAFFSDNYIFLMPGESKTVSVSLKDCDTRGETPKVEVSGFNL